MVSIRQVARACGVSICTVSKALRESRDVAAGTRERVRAVAEAMAYRPSPSLSRMAGRRGSGRKVRGDPLAFLVSKENFTEESAGLRMFRGAAERARELGYDLTIYHPEEFSTWGAMDGIFWSRGVQGILLGPQRVTALPATGMRWERYAAVCIGQPWVTDPLPLVRISYLRAVIEVVNRLAAAGYRKIGAAISVEAETRYQDIAQMGALRGLAAEPVAGARVCAPLVCGQDDVDAVEVYLNKKKPDALVVQSSRLYWVLRERGYRIPDDLGVVAIYRPPDASQWARQVAGIVAPAALMGREAVNLVDASLKHGVLGTSQPRDLILPFEFEWGSSM